MAGGNAKHGRNKKSCDAYKATNRLASNKRRTAQRVAKQHAKQKAKAEFRRTHQGMSRARFEAALKSAPRWSAEVPA